MPANFDAWIAIDSVVRDVQQAAARVETTHLLNVVRAFEANLSRATGLCEMPHRFMRVGQDALLQELAACQLLYGTPFPDNNPPCTLEHQQLITDIAEGRVSLPFSARSAMYYWPVHARAAELYVRERFDTLAGSQLLLMWTAFEVMAGDLWEQALNAHPQTLASLDAEVLPRRGGDDGKKLPMRYLETYKYDMRNRMGTVIRDQRFTFQSLDDIRKAYLSSFPDTCDPGRESFWENPSLKAICQLRNILAHRAGIVDGQFMNERGTHSSVASWNDGDTFRADGLDLQRLIKDFVQFCYSLINSVDAWILANPG